jgi:hypothetical protein
MLAALLLSACAALGLSTPETFNQRALAATGTSQAILRTAIDMRAAGKLSDADRDNVVATVRTAEQGIDLAATIAKTDAPAGTARLQASIAVLNALSAYLATKGTKP